MARNRSRLAEEAQRNPRRGKGQLFDPEREYGEGGQYRRFSDRVKGGAAYKSTGTTVLNGGQRRENTSGNDRKGDLFRVVGRADGRVGHLYDEGKNPYTVWLPMDKDRIEPKKAPGASKRALEQQAQGAPASNNFRQILDGSPERSSSLIELLRELRLPQNRRF